VITFVQKVKVSKGDKFFPQPNAGHHRLHNAVRFLT
jgi:hypothetical protein